jgi:hypothetical protein
MSNACVDGMSVLILKPEWLNAILFEGKRMEIRGVSSKKIGQRIGLMASKTDHIMGMATITDCVGPMTVEEFISNEGLHHCTTGKLPYEKTFGWILDDVVAFDTPIPHKRKRGAIIFSTFHNPHSS